jgi:glycosyltransferase involved in cell wall biosynthesis
MMSYDISVIVATARPLNLIRTIEYIERQSISGLSFEVIIIYEGIGNIPYIDTMLPVNNIIIEKRDLHNDYGAAARDLGILKSSGDYVVFWDDDNIYYPHALVSQYSSANNFDIGVVRTKHNDMIIPVVNDIIAGEIDTMCLCVKRELAIKENWATNGGRYSDYRWVSKLLKHKPSINYSKVVIGYHL